MEHGSQGCLLVVPAVEQVVDQGAVYYGRVCFWELRFVLLGFVTD